MHVRSSSYLFCLVVTALGHWVVPSGTETAPLSDGIGECGVQGHTISFGLPSIAVKLLVMWGQTHLSAGSGKLFLMLYNPFPTLQLLHHGPDKQGLNPSRNDK